MFEDVLRELRRMERGTKITIQLELDENGIPFNQRARAEQTVVSRPQEVSADSEEILHDTVNRREPLELSGRLETPHLVLTRSAVS